MLASHAGNWLKHKTGAERDRWSQTEKSEATQKLATGASHNQPQAGGTKGPGGATAKQEPWVTWWERQPWQPPAVGSRAWKRHSCCLRKHRRQAGCWEKQPGSPLPPPPTFSLAPSPQPPAPISRASFGGEEASGIRSPSPSLSQGILANLPKTQLREITGLCGWRKEACTPDWVS